MKNQREEIEICIKNNQLDRSRFFEVSKQSYQQIITRIEDVFVNKTANWNADIHWTNMGYYNRKLKCVYKVMRNWNIWMEELHCIIPRTEEQVYVLFEDSKNYQPKYWLYESYINELFIVLNECNGLNDFYIVSKKYNWLISLNHHDTISYVGNLKVDID